MQHADFWRIGFTTVVLEAVLVLEFRQPAQ